MSVATSQVEVGIRELKNHLSRYLDGVAEGTEVVVTDRGRPVARIVPVSASADRYAELVAAGIIRPATNRTRTIPERVTLTGPGMISDLVADQRG